MSRSVSGYTDLRGIADELSTSPRTIRAWVKDPILRLPAYRVGGKLLFKWSDVERWIQKFRVKPVDVNEIVTEVLGSAGQRDSRRRRRP